MYDANLLRRIQRRQHSFVVTIPMQIIREAGITQGQVMAFETEGGRITMIPVKSAKGGSADVDRYAKGGSADVDRYAKGGSADVDRYAKEVVRMMESASKEKGTDYKINRLEKLRIK